MQAMNFKLTAIALVGSIAVAGLFFTKVNSQREHEQQVNQFLAKAEKQYGQSSGGVVDTRQLSQTRSNLPANHPPIANHPPVGNMPAYSNKGPHKVTSGAREDFLKVNVAEPWQALDQGEGIASLKYQLKLPNDTKELAIIRMNKEVPLDTVVNIWKQKVGLGPNSTIKYQPFTNNAEQQMYMTEIRGPFKTIVLAIHKGEKYTFFRMTGTNQDSAQALEAFKGFISDAEITG